MSGSQRGSAAPAKDGAARTGRARNRLEPLACIVAGLLAMAACGDLPGYPPLEEPIAGEVLITRAADLEALRGVRFVNGNLQIEPVPGEVVSSLEPLSGLEEIRGELAVLRATGLRDLSDLSSLRSVGALRLWANPDLESPGITALHRIDGTLRIESNPSLASLAGFTSLESVFRILVRGNDMLASLDGLEDAPLLAGPTAEATVLEIVENPVLTDVSALAAVRRWRRLALYENPVLADLSPFSAVTYCQSLDLRGAALELGPSSFASLDSCTNVWLEDIPPLRDLEFLRGVWVRSLLVSGTGVGSLAGLEQLPSLNSLRLRDNPELTSLDGLESLTDVAGSVAIEGNPALVSLQGLDGLRACRSCIVARNRSLCDSLVVRWMEGIEVEDTSTQYGNRRCRTPTTGPEPGGPPPDPGAFRRPVGP